MTPDAFRLVLKIRELRYGDALDFGLYKLCHVMDARGWYYYAIAVNIFQQPLLRGKQAQIGFICCYRIQYPHDLAYVHHVRRAVAEKMLALGAHSWKVIANDPDAMEWDGRRRGTVVRIERMVLEAA